MLKVLPSKISLHFAGEIHPRGHQTSKLEGEKVEAEMGRFC